MRTGLIARKLGMTRLFQDDGAAVPVTVLHLDEVQVVAHVDADRGLLMLRGAVPGAVGGFVLVRDAVKGARPDGVPFPAALIETTPAQAPTQAGESA